jgi:hypothetical protein
MTLHHSAIDSKATLTTSHSNFIFLLYILNIGLFSEFHIQAPLQFVFLPNISDLRMLYAFSFFYHFDLQIVIGVNLAKDIVKKIISKVPEP